ncbi:MAG TPA: hypothetical protein VKB86_05060 [Pyrinomonadaceae bacterium]|nr:hypothetical protein [Pyrinomonadaceae bacterium]
MRNRATYTLRILMGLALGLALVAVNISAQQPSPSPKKDSANAKTQSSADSEVGDDAGNYTIVSSMEFGYRGLKVDGNLNKYRSDLNYKAGPRVFDSSFLMKSKKDTGAFLDTLLVTSTGWGADPYGNVRISAENSKWFRFDGTYRRFKYFNFLNNFANPTTTSTNGSVVVPASTITGRQGFDVMQKMGDFDLTILPKNNRIKFNIGFSPERYTGTTYVTYHAGGGEFFLPALSDSRANDFRIGADWKLGPVDFSLLQGFRRFTDDSAINFSGVDPNYLATTTTNVATVNNFVRQQPTHGSINYTRFSAHTFLARKVDITARLIYSSATSNVNTLESITGINWNTRVTVPGLNYAPPNVLTASSLTYNDNVKEPSFLGDLGVTYTPTDKLRISDTFRVETFHINAGTLYSSAFYISRNGTALPPLLATNLGTSKITSFRKILNTIEGDYQFNNRYSFHFGYRYGTRRETEFYNGYNPGAVLPAAVPNPVNNSVEENHTNVFFGGFKARPVKTLTIFFDAERGTADNIFTRVGEYNYTNFKARTRYTPNRKLALSLSLVTKDNSDPGSVEGVSLADFGVSQKSRVFTSSIDYAPNSRISFSSGYSYDWVNSDAVINFAYAVPPATTTQGQYTGHSLYFMRNNFFYFETTAQVTNRITFYAAYRINKDNGQGNRVSSPLPNPSIGIMTPYLITSYPMSYQSPEARLAIKLNRWLDWNIGYQYYNYRESPLVSINPQNYHAHLPYTSLRIYFGRGRG